MTSALEQRRAVAQRLAHQLVGLPNAIAVLVFGSVASGHVDKVSDIDMLVVCEPDMPAAAVRLELLGPLGEGWAP